MTVAYDFAATKLGGAERQLDDYRGKVLLIVNTASKCGFTPQYEGLEELHRQYAQRGLAVLGFPCNQFGNQEPGDAEQIASFCSTAYDVTFEMFAKVDVNGSGAHPLFRWLQSERHGLLGGRIKWNFTKFLVGADGSVVERYGPATKPYKIAADIEGLLPEAGAADSSEPREPRESTGSD